jgi:Flp pilus assembly protein TadD
MRREWRFCTECGSPAGEAAADVLPEIGTRRSAPVAAVSAAPSSANAQAAALNEQGIAAFQTDRFEEAARLFRQAVELDPTNAHLHARLAAALDEMDIDDEALAEYQRALELNPRETTALLNLGYLYSEQERYDEARELWEEVIRINPRSAEAKDARENLQHLDEL